MKQNSEQKHRKTASSDDLAVFVEDNKTYIRERITALRMEKNLSEYQVSRGIGKNNSYIQKITADQSLPSLDALIDICAYFEITLEEFFCRDEEKREQLAKQKRLQEVLDLMEQATDEEVVLIEQTMQLLLKNRENQS